MQKLRTGQSLYVGAQPQMGIDITLPVKAQEPLQQEGCQKFGRTNMKHILGSRWNDSTQELLHKTLTGSSQLFQIGNKGSGLQAPTLDL